MVDLNTILVLVVSVTGLHGSIEESTPSALLELENRIEEALPLPPLSPQYDDVGIACGCCMKSYHKPTCNQWNGQHKTCMWTGCNSLLSNKFNGMKRSPQEDPVNNPTKPLGRLLSERMPHGGFTHHPRDSGKICWSCSDAIGTPCTVKQLQTPCPNFMIGDQRETDALTPSPAPAIWDDGFSHIRYHEPPTEGGPRLTSGESSVHYADKRLGLTEKLTSLDDLNVNYDSVQKSKEDWSTFFHWDYARMARDAMALNLMSNESVTVGNVTEKALELSANITDAISRSNSSSILQDVDLNASSADNQTGNHSKFALLTRRLATDLVANVSNESNTTELATGATLETFNITSTNTENKTSGENTPKAITSASQDMQALLAQVKSLKAQNAALQAKLPQEA